MEMVSIYNVSNYIALDDAAYRMIRKIIDVLYSGLFQ